MRGSSLPCEPGAFWLCMRALRIPNWYLSGLHFFELVLVQVRSNGAHSDEIRWYVGG